jgi:hypothetical protein
MRPARARSSGSETLSPIQSSAGYTIDMHESDFSEAAGFGPDQLEPVEPLAYFVEDQGRAVAVRLLAEASYRIWIFTSLDGGR